MCGYFHSIGLRTIVIILVDFFGFVEYNISFGLTTDEKDLRNLQNLDDTYLRPDFLDQLNVLKNKIHRQCRQKMINGIGMNMPMFIVFLEKFVNAFNSGKMPSIASAYAALIENEIYEHAESAKETFRSGLESSFGHAGPMERTELYFKVNRLRDASFEVLNNCFGVGERNEDLFNKYKVELIEFMDREEARLFDKNRELSLNHNQNILYTQMNQYLESVDDIYDEDVAESEILIDEVSNKLDTDFLASYLEKRVGVDEVIPLAEQIKVFTFQAFMGFKQNSRKIETRKRNMKVREGEKDKGTFMQKNMELTMVQKILERNQEELESLQQRHARADKGNNAADLDELQYELDAKKGKFKKLDKDFEDNKHSIRKIQMDIEAKRKKKRRGCF